MSAEALATTTKEPAVAVNVRILEKEYQVACPESERHDLMRSADMLNDRMRMIRDSGKIVGLDRIAVMAALNLTHDLLRLKETDNQLDESLMTRIRGLTERAESALDLESND